MQQSPIWVVEDSGDFRADNRRAFAGRDVQRKRIQDDRRQRIAENRARHVNGQGSDPRKRKYENGQSARSARRPEPPAEEPDGGSSPPPTDSSLAELVEKEAPDYIDAEVDPREFSAAQQ